MTLISFVKSHRLLTAAVLLLVAVLAILTVCIVREMRLLGIIPGGIGDVLGSDTSDGVSTPPAVSDTEQTEPDSDDTESDTDEDPIPPPFVSVGQDAAYYPSTHESEVFSAQTVFDEEYRIYAAYPNTPSESFNDYCIRTVNSLLTSAKSPQTKREGGGTAVTVDYDLYLTDRIYSAVFTCKTNDTETHRSALSVVVLIFDTKSNTVYAPLDLYDMTKASEPLAKKIRAGYEAAFERCGLAPDTRFLDEVCTPDPSSFVNIAVDARNLYFFAVYEDMSQQQLLCASVSLDEMRQYTWESYLPPPEDDIIDVEIPSYDVSDAVGESEMVGDDYFDDALFIGNSLIVGLQRTVPLRARFLATVGLNVSQVFNKALIPQTDGSVITISEAIGKERFSKVYLMFGINELGWGSIASFINYYGQIVDRIRQVNPEAIIYVQSILPINEEKWAKSRDYQSCVNNYAVATFNQKIVEMCRAKGVCFVNVAETLTD